MSLIVAETFERYLKLLLCNPRCLDISVSWLLLRRKRVLWLYLNPEIMVRLWYGNRINSRNDFQMCDFYSTCWEAYCYWPALFFTFSCSAKSFAIPCIDFFFTFSFSLLFLDGLPIFLRNLLSFVGQEACHQDRTYFMGRTKKSCVKIIS